MIRLITCLGLLFSVLVLQGQDLQQVVKGKIVDQITGKGIEGANVKIEVGSLVASVQTDVVGNFRSTVNTGRYRVTVSHAAYLPATQEILVIAGKETIVNFTLAENAIQLKEVEIASAPDSHDVAGERSLTIEKTFRIPANFFDPVRAITAYPGVVTTNDQGNSIIVRGNSPNGLLWRLNGADILNPNHLANAGTLSDRPVASGGGVNILSAQMLDRTSFYTGTIPTSYGNTLAGVIDMGLREGNKEKHEFTAQASLIGIDLAAEGPFSKKASNTSFTTNYRYSTVGLLTAAGINFGDEAITFQDLSFNIHNRGKDGSVLSLFGLWGNSKNKFEHKDEVDWKEDKDMYDIDYTSNKSSVGLNYQLPLQHGRLMVAVAYSYSDQERKAQLSQLPASGQLYLVVDSYQLTSSLLSNHVKYSTAFGNNVSLDAGMLANVITNDLKTLKAYASAGLGSTFNSLNGDPSGTLLQPYVNATITFSPVVHLNAGVRYVDYTFNNTSAVEPRLALGFKLTGHASLDASYGITSQTQLAQVYATQGNNNLELTKSHHADVAYRTTLAGDYRLRAGVFYQKLYDVPAEVLNGFVFSAINLLEGDVPPSLTSSGTGENYGSDVTIEKEFFNKNYVLIGGSYYKSTFDAGDGIKRNSRFDGNYTFSAVHAKEWSRGSKRAINLNSRILYLGGLRQSPVDIGASSFSGDTFYDDSNPYSQKLKDYFRVDVRLSFRKNKPGYTRTFAVDIQNVTNQQNEAYQYYDRLKGGVVTKYQLGIIPLLVYRIDF